MPVKKPSNSEIGELAKNIENLGYSKEQSSQVASVRSPGNTLKELAELHPLLINLHFSYSEIISIAAHSGGAKNLEAVIEYYQKFHVTLPPYAQLSHDDLIKIVGHEGGSKNLEAVIRYYREIHNTLPFYAQLSRYNLLRIVGHHGGSKNLEIVSQYYKTVHESLSPEKRLTLNELVKLISRSGGYNNIALYVHCCSDMLKLGLTKFQLLKFFTRMTHKDVKQAISDWLNSLILPQDIEMHRKGILELLSSSYSLESVNPGNASQTTLKRRASDESNAMLLVSLGSFSAQVPENNFYSE